MQSFSSLSLRTRARPLLALAFVASIAACGSDSNSGTGPTDVSGTYTLTTVDGGTLPQAFANSEHHIVVNSATLIMGTDHSYSVDATGSAEGVNGNHVIADAGTYAVSGSTVTLTSSTFSGAHYTAASTSTTLTTTVPGAFVNSTNTSFTLVFTKS